MKNNYSRFVIIALLTLIVFLYALTLQAHAAGLPAAYQQTVTGVVTDEAGVPLPGVSVIVKGTNRGTVTSIDGEYQIEAAPQAVLVFSYMGFERVEIPVEDRREIIVQLIEDINALEEVEINAGYYNTTRRESTGSISRVTAEEIEMQPVINPLQALQGRMAGVEIIPGGSHPGMAPTIRIRGRNSLRDEGNFPLYIIDGVPINSAPIDSNSLLGNPGPGMDPLNFLNLSNIASIEVLKDADATAIYGSRGANGVVLITTKQGEFGDFDLQARVYSGTATVANRVDLLNTEQYLEIRKRALENDGVEPTADNAYDLVIWDQNRYTDWQDFFFGGTSTIQDVNLSTSGGGENTFFRIGGSYHEQGSINPVDNQYSKVTASVDINHASKDKKLRIDLSVNYGIDKNNLEGNVDFLNPAFSLPPNAPSVFNEDGSLNWTDWFEAGLDNPLAGFHNSSIIHSNTLLSSLGVSYRVLPSLTLRTNAGYTYFNNSETVKMPVRSYNPAYWENIDHRSSHLQNFRESWIIEPQLIYEQRMGEGTLDAIIGTTFQESVFNLTGFQGEGYVAEPLIGNLSAAESIINGSNLNTTYRYAAIFGRLGFNWEEKYFINLTGRRDGSSRFGPGNRLANFWAVGGAWIFSEELAKDSDFLSFGKVRGSYGTTGSDQIGDYGYLEAYEATPGPGGLYPTILSNPDYSWEINKKLEAALVLGFFEDRLDLAVSWYRNRSSNQLVGLPLPAITGFSSVQANLPATVENTGWEVVMSALILQSEDSFWETSFNITFPENELLQYPNIDQSSYANIYKVGHPLDISLLYEYTGIDPETGFYTIADVNEDERYDYEDRIIIHENGRQFFGGVNNSTSYRNFSLQFLWEFVKQKGTLTLFETGAIGAQREVILEALTENSRFQRPSMSPLAQIAYSRVLNTTFPVVDASFIRLRTLSLGYSLPAGVLTAVGLEEGRVFLNGQNLLTLTDYKGMDPEMPFGGVSFAGLRTITAGLQFTF